jgi:hypothetical protein
MRYLCTLICFTALSALCSTRGSIGAELQATPQIDGTSYQANEVWIVKNGTIVRKITVGSRHEAMTIYGPRGGRIVFCPPGGCPPEQAPPSQPAEPPKFDFPGDKPVDPPKLELPTTDTTSADASLATLAAVAAGAAGIFVGYKNQKTDPSLVKEAVDAQKETIPSLEVH